MVKASIEAWRTKSIKGSNDERQRVKAGITKRQNHKRWRLESGYRGRAMEEKKRNEGKIIEKDRGRSNSSEMVEEFTKRKRVNSEREGIQGDDKLFKKSNKT